MQDLCPALCVMLAWAGGVSCPPARERVSSFLPSCLRVPQRFAAHHVLFLLTGAPESLVKSSPSGPGELPSLPEPPEP